VNLDYYGQNIDLYFVVIILEPVYSWSAPTKRERILARWCSQLVMKKIVLVPYFMT